uniref:Uncharacterized protein n=1 Tax=Globisporangium ultimum (strain ATCC 200006 / CBS 805.95 / DAOM BR144) TaxID=431595 RepID=K3WWG7_GLOUD
MTPEERRRARSCIVTGCNNYIVHLRLCFKHGGNDVKSRDAPPAPSSEDYVGVMWTGVNEG